MEDNRGVPPKTCLSDMKIYLDTSIPSFVLRDNLPDKQKATQKLLAEIKSGKISAFVSTVVIRELKATKDEQKRKKLLEVLDSFPYHLIEVDEKMQELADKYVASGIIPKQYQDDALHIATAVISGVTTVVSWNLRHMVNIFVKRKINSINIAEGYPQVDLVTPWQIVPPEEE